MTAPTRPVHTTHLLTRAEVAALFGVAACTVTDWADKGWLNTIRTPGGQRRYDEAQVRGLLGAK